MQHQNQNIREAQIPQSSHSQTHHSYVQWDHARGVGNYFQRIAEASSKARSPTSRTRRTILCSILTTIASIRRTSWKTFLGVSGRPAGTGSQFYNFDPVTSPWNVRYSNGSRAQYAWSVSLRVWIRTGSIVNLTTSLSLVLLMAPSVTRE